MTDEIVQEDRKILVRHWNKNQHGDWHLPVAKTIAMTHEQLMRSPARRPFGEWVTAEAWDH